MRKIFKPTALFITIFSLILFLVTAALHLPVSAQVVSGLVAAYGFNEGLGTTAADASGLNNNGILSGATWTTAGKYGGAVSFDGVNDLVNVADSASLDLTTGMTLEAWVNPSSTIGSKTVVAKERGSTNIAYTLYSSSDSNTPWTAFTDSTGAMTDLNGPSQLPVNSWTHLAVTYDKRHLGFMLTAP